VPNDEHVIKTRSYASPKAKPQVSGIEKW